MFLKMFLQVFNVITEWADFFILFFITLAIIASGAIYLISKLLNEYYCKMRMNNKHNLLSVKQSMQCPKQKSTAMKWSCPSRLACHYICSILI